MKFLDRRWWLIALALAALLIGVPLGAFEYMKHATNQDWIAAEAETDLLDPRWRLLDIEADREVIPAGENSALHIIAMTGAARDFAVSRAPNYDLLFDNLPPTAQLNEQQEELIRRELAKIAKPLDEARRLKDLPKGRFPITYTDDFFSTVIPNQQNARAIAEWLQHDAYLLAHQKEFDRAVESCRALMNAGQAMGDEPLLISVLIRIALDSMAIRTLERVLAQGQASEGQLRLMQALLDREIGTNHFLQGLRGERAGSRRLCETLRDGKVKMSEVVGSEKLGTAMDRDFDEWLVDTIPYFITRFFPEYLRHMNRGIEIAKLPIHAREPEIMAWEAEAKDTENALIKLLTPALKKIHQADCRSQAMLRSAFVAMACERYRLRHKDGAWPASLNDLVKEKLLDAIPADPMDNQPIRYRHTKDGIVVYSIGFDRIDNQGNIDRNRFPEDGVDIGFRLWNVDQRRQAALPPVELPKEPDGKN